MLHCLAVILNPPFKTKREKGSENAFTVLKGRQQFHSTEIKLKTVLVPTSNLDKLQGVSFVCLKLVGFLCSPVTGDQTCTQTYGFPSCRKTCI